MPVTLIIFNRPNITKKLIDSLRAIKPKKLFIIADGPRSNKSNDHIKCKQTREIIDSIDWECEIKKNYASTNLGCKQRISSGLDWVFEEVEETIILEDDCIPSPIFFSYCEFMLKKYKNNSLVMSIEGTRVTEDYKVLGVDEISKYAGLWGWATWKESWSKIDLDFKTYNYKSKYHLFKSLGITHFLTYNRLFELCKQDKIDSWGYAWIYSILKEEGYVVLPSNNLIENVGFGNDSTHTTNNDSKLSKLNISKESIVLSNNNEMHLNSDYDKEYFEIHNDQSGIIKTLKQLVYLYFIRGAK